VGNDDSQESIESLRNKNEGEDSKTRLPNITVSSKESMRDAINMVR
jgi:hypothetical protein